VGPGEKVFYHTQNLSALQWNDKHDVTMSLTLHRPITVPFFDKCDMQINLTKAFVDRYSGTKRASST
jgi:hypothetical protein